MSINKMLIDATHPEETRVVVLRNNRVEEFDYESAARKLLRGSIYLAKITRVEPSLQASFVDYGGNRHGFLAFAEIHPDYYQIPHADKLALLEQESRDQAAYDADLDDDDGPSAGPRHDEPAGPRQDGPLGPSHDANHTRNDAPLGADEAGDLTAHDHDFEATAIDVTPLLPPEPTAEGDDGDSAPRNRALEAADPASDIRHADPDEHVHISADPGDDESHPIDARAGDAATDDDEELDDDDDVVESLNDGNDDDDDDDDVVQALSDDDDEDHAPGSAAAPARRARTPRPRRRARSYKIQEVIKRRQIVLIQVVKEERGNKGAALTTYLSLAGRYTVLMPNTARGGGISRKITNVQDRKRLKAIAEELEVPEGMGLIIRTAGAARTKQEIKRDFEYLLRLWENVRNLTLESTAPSLVYEEGNLIKRSIRDLYTKEIDEVVVAGEHAFKEARNFMRMLMPSHAKNVIKHEDPQSLFAKYRIEHQLNQMFSPNVQLRSGGYLVINQTEALVAIDVNSGKSTREFSIEETALNTNLEAAEEVARQLKLRDLAGLIVVDFIDMEENRNNRAVERRLKDSLRVDRARIQVGRISHFGLLEMSRQRLRTGVLEGSTMQCEHCQGSGVVRSIESVSLAVLRGLEDSLVAGKMASCAASCSAEVALYLLNQKRAFIQELEERYGVVIHVRASAKQQGANYLIEPMHDVVPDRPRRIVRDAVNIDTGFADERIAANDDDRDAETDDDADAVATHERTSARSDDDSRPRRRRRRRGARLVENRDESRDHSDRASAHPRDDADDHDDTDDHDAAQPELTTTAAIDDHDDDVNARDEGESSEDRPRRSRRRGRRGGRRHRDQRAAGGTGSADDEHQDGDQHQQGHDPQQSHANQEGHENGAGAPHHAFDEDHRDDARAPDQHPPIDQPQPATIAARMETLAPIDQPPTHDRPATETPPAHAGAPTTSIDDQPQTDSRTHQPAPERAARSQPVASEPVRQRVVVGPNGTHPEPEPAASDNSDDDTAKPSRRGWWQRQFGG